MLATIHTPHQKISKLHFDGNTIEDIHTDSVPLNYDTVESPHIKVLVQPSESEQTLFNKMKYECNRLYSFQNRWPVNSIEPESLAEAGLFYLQYEDRVQCPFCGVILYNWTSNDKPFREHMRKSPKCPFLMGHDVGNITRFPKNGQSEFIHTQPSVGQLSSYSTIASYKPKHPRMSDIKRRLLTYSDWPLHFLKPHNLAECGLYYTGVSDVVKCFFCGGSLGNWETTDDPWEEHTTFFPYCTYLTLAKKRYPQSLKATNGIEKSPEKHSSEFNTVLPSSEIIQQAFDIFPETLVMQAVKGNKEFSSLQELCDYILELKQKNNFQTHPVSNNVAANINFEGPKVNGDALLCKICMDRDRSVVFQPCGHLISCWNCSQLVKDCPVCRQPILNVIKTYFS